MRVADLRKLIDGEATGDPERTVVRVARYENGGVKEFDIIDVFTTDNPNEITLEIEPRRTEAEGEVPNG